MPANDARAAWARTTWLERAVTALMLALLVLLAREAALHSIDFPVYHRAARQVIAGNYELYPPEAYGGQPFPSQGFRYAPAIAFLFVPFGWLPLQLAALVFFVLKLVVLWWVGATVVRRAGSSGWGRRGFLIALVVVGGYLVEELRFGNAHFFVIALMVLAYDRSESGEVWTPALALAVAIAAKLTPLVLLGYFVLRRRGAVCFATLAILGLLVILPAAIIGLEANSRQLHAFATYALEKVDEGDNYSLRGALVRYLTPGQADVSHVRADFANLSMPIVNALWVCGLLGLGLAGLAAMWRDDDDPVTRLLELSIVLTGMVLASPHTQRRYFIALYVPVVTLLALLPRTDAAAERRTIVIGLLAVSAPATILPLVFGGRRLALFYEASSPYFFGALVLFWILVVMTRRRKTPIAS
jgi:Glycosyltransferase family 87